MFMDMFNERAADNGLIVNSAGDRPTRRLTEQKMVKSTSEKGLNDRQMHS